MAAVLGPGDQSPQIKGNQATTLERIGHLPGHDPLGQQFGDRRFTYAWFTNQHRIVLAAPGEHLNQPADVGIAADHRIQHPGPGQGSEIPAELIEGTGLRQVLQRGGRRWGDGGSWGPGNLCPPGQQAGADALIFPEGLEQIRGIDAAAPAALAAQFCAIQQ